MGDAADRAHPFKRFTRRRGDRAGTRFHAAIASGETGEMIYADQAMLAAWGDTPSGQTVRLWLDEDSALHPFAGSRKRQGKDPGSVFQLVMVELAEDEQPVDQVQRSVVEHARKKQTLSQQAHLMISSPMFVQYLKETRPGLVKNWDADTARAYVKTILKIESLSDLDRHKGFADRFHEQVRKPYARWGGHE